MKTVQQFLTSLPLVVPKTDKEKAKYAKLLTQKNVMKQNGFDSDGFLLNYGGNLDEVVAYSQGDANNLKCNDLCKEPLLKRVKIDQNEWYFKTVCSCRLNHLEIIEKQRKQDELRNHKQNLIDMDYIPPEILKNNFSEDKFKGSKVSQTCREYANKWEQIKAENIGLILSGNVGQGKTFYACCVANELINQGKYVAFKTINQLVAKLATFTEENAEFVDKLLRAELLILDDFGTERKTEYSTEQVFNIINKRLESKKPTIITTNIDLQKWNTDENITGQRIKDRLFEMCPIEIVAETSNQSIRQHKSSKKAENFAKIVDLKK